MNVNEMTIEGVYNSATVGAIDVMGAPFGVSIRTRRGPGEKYTLNNIVGGVPIRKEAKVSNGKEYIILVTKLGADLEPFWSSVEQRLFDEK